MAYAVKYRIDLTTQAGPDLKVELLEDEYVGDVIEYQGTSFSLEYIPNKDDRFDPIIASQLLFGIDVTDDLENLPDLTTLNDRKYLCRLVNGFTTEWQGWVLSDEARLRFNTGVKTLEIVSICGLGMLGNIDFEYSDTSDFNSIVTLSQIIVNCLQQIEFPTNLNILYSCSIYAAEMLDPDGSFTSVFSQAYTPLHSTQANGVYKNSLQVLREIIFSFGCRIYQAKGRWNITQVNQMALDQPYYELVNGNGTTQETGQFTEQKNIPTDCRFIDAIQDKLFKKGFNNIISENPIQYPQNYIFNADLKLNDGTDATGWVRTTSGTGTVTIGDLTTGKNNTWILNIPNASVDLAQVEAISQPSVAKNDQLVISWTFFDGTFANVSGHACEMLLTINDGVNTYYLDTDGDWQLAFGPITNYFGVPDDEIVQNGSTPYSITVKPAPISGLVGFGLRLNTDTGTSMTVGGFSMRVNSPFRSMIVSSEINDSNEYTLRVSFPYGMQSEQDGKFSFIGFLCDEEGNNLQTWYNYERKATQNFRSLVELMVQNYVNMYRINLIDIEGNFEGMGNSDRTSYLTRFTFNDTDPDQINVSGYRYILGNTKIDLPADRVNTRFLLVSDENVDAEITVEYENNQDTGVTTVGRRLGTTATLTKPEACALSYGTQKLYFVDDTYSIGDIVYTSNTLSTPFNGAMLWWKVEIVELASSRAMRIGNSGNIMDIQTC